MHTYLIQLFKWLEKLVAHVCLWKPHFMIKVTAKQVFLPMQSKMLLDAIPEKISLKKSLYTINSETPYWKQSYNRHFLREMIREGIISSSQPHQQDQQWQVAQLPAINFIVSLPSKSVYCILQPQTNALFLSNCLFLCMV